MTAVTVVDYGASNLLNVVRALEHCGAEVEVTNEAPTIWEAKKLVLPGVGAFGDCSNALAAQELDLAIKKYISSGRLFLGICVGMQIMFDVGEEFGTYQGLGIVPGKVSKISAESPDGSMVKIPHMGWRDLRKPSHLDTWEGTLLESLEGKDCASVYFVHSYIGRPEEDTDLLADVDYNGISISAAVKKGNAYGMQFHPEKSGETGLAILRSFLAQR